MVGQQNLFDTKKFNRYELRIDLETKREAQEKASKDGTSLAHLIKCFIIGYLAGDILADSILKFERKD